MEKIKSEKDQEIFNLREQSQRLQVQLNNGHVGFSDFKEKKAKEVQELKNTIEAFSLKVWKQLVQGVRGQSVFFF